jgi:hypothetical protein
MIGLDLDDVDEAITAGLPRRAPNSSSLISSRMRCWAVCSPLIARAAKIKDCLRTLGHGGGLLLGS